MPAQVVGLLEQLQPLAHRLGHPGADRHLQGHQLLAPLERRQRLLAGCAAHRLVAGQDAGDEPCQPVRHLGRREVEPVADLDQLELADQIVLVILGLQKQADRHVLKAHHVVRLRRGTHDATIAAMDAATIRAMRADEARSVAQLLVRANQDNLSAFPPDVASAYRAELFDVAARSSCTEVYVVELAGHLVGSVTFVADAVADAHPWPPGGSVLRFLAVDPDARGQGLGERLTRECICRAKARGAQFLGLHTAPVMLAARRLYERLGFERAPEHDFHPATHYGAGADPDEEPWGLAYLLRFAPDSPRT